MSDTFGIDCYQTPPDPTPTTVYAAVINTPGYLPDSADPPPMFDTAQEAWTYLAEERNGHEIDAEADAHSDCLTALYALANGDVDVSEWADPQLATDGVGTVYGTTPGYDGDHDLGLAYSVLAVTDTD